MRFLALFFLIASYASAAFTFSNLTGGESGDASELEAATSITVSSGAANTGNYGYALAASATPDGEVFVAQGDQTAASFRFYYRHGAGSGSIAGFVDVIDQSNNRESILSITSGGVIQCLHGTAFVNGDSISANTWYRIDVFWERENGTSSDGKCSVRVNGGTAASLTNGNGNNTGINRIGFNGDGDYTQDFDDFYIASSTSSESETFQPDGGIVALRPEADSTDSGEDEFTSTGGDGEPSWNEVDDDPAADATYATSSSGSGTIDQLWQLTDQTVGTINYYLVACRCLRSNGPARTHRLRHKRGGGTSTNSADLGLTGSVDYYTYNPSDQASNQSQLDDLQAGGQSSEAGGREMEITESYVMLDFQATTGPIFVTTVQD